MASISDLWSAWLFGVVPLIGWLVWHWNELRYALPQKLRCYGTGVKLPPGDMGLPFFGEMLTFLWYFKIIRRPDNFINAKRHKYGDGVGLYRTHLLGLPSIIACLPSTNRFVFQSSDDFRLDWPTAEIVGVNSLVAVQGPTHTRIRSFVSRAINQPAALRRIAAMVQPGVKAALESWAHKGRIIGMNEVKKVTFKNIGKFFASLEPGTVLDTLDELFTAIVEGVRANPINFPGTAFHKALQCRKEAVAIFREELERRKKNPDESMEKGDVMSGLMQIKDDEGKQLSDMEVIDNIVSLVVAGYTSTANSITWAIYYLAKYPDVLQKLREENMHVSKKKGELLTSDDFSKLKYTNKVVEEAIRLANVAAIVFRTAAKDVDYKGYRIPKGWQVMLWVRYIHTNPENYPNPMCFNPDRWDEPAKPGMYQVFGGGPRLCPGNMLARLQVAIFLHYLAVGYKWELINPDAEISYLPNPKPVDGVEISISKLVAEN